MPPRRNAATLPRLGAIALLALAGNAFAAATQHEEPQETVESQRDLDDWTRDVARGLPARRLEPARIKEVLISLEPPKPEPTAWERFQRWLNAWLGSDSEKKLDLPDWLKDLFDGIPSWVFKAVFWTLLGGLVLALLVIVFVELRAAGLWRRRAQAQAVAAAASAATAAGAATPAEVSLGLAGIAGLPLREQPAALLQWAIRQLILSRVLPPDRSLTNGELLALVRTRAPAELPRFRSLARAAEAVVYGGRAPSEAETRALLEALRNPEAPPPAAEATP